MTSNLEAANQDTDKGDLDHLVLERARNNMDD